MKRVFHSYVGNALIPSDVVIPRVLQMSGDAGGVPIVSYKNEMYINCHIKTYSSGFGWRYFDGFRRGNAIRRFFRNRFNLPVTHQFITTKLSARIQCCSFRGVRLTVQDIMIYKSDVLGVLFVIQS